MMHDLVIRNGTIVDGSGGEPFQGDVAIVGGRIAELGRTVGRGREEIDARDRLVTPGFVDIHTHLDGQATWDPLLTPSCWHGVTTAVMGNCGVGFAPARATDREYLIGLMEGVEDIPGTALAAGIDWQWESFPEYLTALERTPRVFDIAAQIAHGPLRFHVMGERGARNEPATAEEIGRMAQLVREAVLAGALGFTTSRTIVHRAISGDPVPGTFAAEDELFGIGRVLGELGAGLFELAPAGVMGEDMAAPDREMDWMRRLSREIKRPVSFVLAQHDADKEHWRELLRLSGEAAKQGAQIRPQVGSRPTTLLMGHQTFHPFELRPTYQRLVHLPLAERVVKLREPAVRAAILSEQADFKDQRVMFIYAMITSRLDRLFLLGDPPDYEPGPEKSIAALAAKAGKDPYEVLYDRMLERDGKALFLFTILSYSDGDFEALRTMLEHPTSVFGLGDAGAHCGALCDASMTTYLISHWVRDRTRGPKLSLPWAVRKMTRDTAELYGLNDRGVLARGKKADLNVIDFDALQLEAPVMVHDLPASGRRFIQRARGYDATIASGVVTMRNGEHTGALPGRLLRGAQSA
jgi:N-acyl-D-amino-acid deacylase